MPVNENDLEMLSAYLDRELPVAECEGLWRRLAVERDLATELDQLRADMATRNMSWTSFEPDDTAVARLQYQVMRSARRDDVWSMLRRIGSVASSVAAILLFGFTVGWMGRGNAITPGLAGRTGTQATSIAEVHSASPSASVSTVAYPLYDERGAYIGKIEPLKPFTNEEEAQQFMQHLNGSGEGQQTPRDSNLMQSSNHF